MNHVVDQARAEMLAFLEQLVNIDSGTYDKAGVDQVASLLIARYEALGFKVTVFPNDHLGNNYRLVHQDAVDPQILIVAHLDTVFPKGTVEVRPFKIEGERAYGPGVIDMKASHVQVYYSIKTLIELGSEAYKNVEILLNCDEEIGSPTSRPLIEEAAKGKEYALVMEPARIDGTIVSARRGVGTYKLNIIGKASHSGVAPQDGISAIQELSYKIQALHALSDHPAGISVNVGIISGGVSVNTIAPNAYAEINIRLATAEQGEYLDQKIREICSTPALAGVQLELTGGVNRPPMIKTPEIAALVDLILEEADKLGIVTKDIATGGGSDASFTAAMGIPTVDGLGPVGGYAHTEDEYLEIPSFFERTALFINVVDRLSKVGGE